MHKDKVSYVNGDQPSNPAMVDEGGYVSFEKQPNPHVDKDDRHPTLTAKPGSSTFVEETPYSNVR